MLYLWGGRGTRCVYGWRRGSGVECMDRWEEHGVYVGEREGRRREGRYCDVCVLQ